MVQLIELGDGTLRKQFSPMEEYPFYSDWLEKLLERRAASSYREKHQTCKGHGCEHCTNGLTTVIKPYDRHQEQSVDIMPDGTVRVICICCAKPVHFREAINTSTTFTSAQGKGSHKRDGKKTLLPAGRIRIGGVVQFKEDEPCNERHGSRIISVVRKWRLRSVSKTGFGCKECAEQFHSEDTRISEENASRRFIYDTMSQVYTMRRDFEKLKTLKEPKEFTAWLDVFTRSVSAGQLPEWV